MEKAPRFITLEGGEGSGKSTLLEGLKASLSSRGICVQGTREPGGTPGAEEIRSLLLKGHVTRWDPFSEALLLFAARRDLIVNFIRPALERGEWVICDRFVDSTCAYQGMAGGLDVSFIIGLYGAISGGLEPDLTFILDIAPEIGLARAEKRLGQCADREGRFEQMSLSFHQKARQAFLEMAAKNPQRYCVLNGENAPEKLLAEALDKIEERGWAL